jgi:hypothetical protein
MDNISIETKLLVLDALVREAEWWECEICYATDKPIAPYRCTDRLNELRIRRTDLLRQLMVKVDA